MPKPLTLRVPAPSLRAPGGVAFACLALACLALALFCGIEPARAAEPAPAPAPIDLRPRFAAGRASRFETWSKQVRSITTFVNGQKRAESTSTSIITTGMRWRVDSVQPDGSAQCTYTVEWVRMETQKTVGDDDGEEPGVVDTRQPSDHPAFGFFKALTDSPLKANMRADGTVASIEGAEAIKARMNEDESAFAPDALDWMEMVSDLATVPGAPAEAAPSGPWEHEASWNHDVMGQRVGRNIQKASFTLQGVESVSGIPVATITANGTQRLEADLSALPEGGQGLQVSLPEGRFTQQIMVDLQRHEVVGRHSTEAQTTRIERAAGEVTVAQVIRELNVGQVLRVAEEGD